MYGDYVKRGKFPRVAKGIAGKSIRAWLGAVEVAREYFGSPRELEFTLAAKGIVDGRDWKGLRQREPGQFQFLYLHYKPHRKAPEAAEKNPLMVLAQWLRANGVDVTPETLAMGMGYKNKSSLYRKPHSREQVRAACRVTDDPTAPTADFADGSPALTTDFMYPMEPDEQAEKTEPGPPRREGNRRSGGVV
jgi:hypothetical protein